MSDFAIKFHEKLVARHDAYMKLLLDRFKEIRKTDGKDAALCILSMHEEAGDSMLTDTDWSVLKTYIEDDTYHKD